MYFLRNSQGEDANFYVLRLQQCLHTGFKGRARGEYIIDQQDMFTLKNSVIIKVKNSFRILVPVENGFAGLGGVFSDSK